VLSWRCGQFSHEEVAVKRFSVVALTVTGLFAVVAARSAATDPAASVTTYFAPSIPTPFDVLFYEGQGQDRQGSATARGKYYIAKLTMQNEREGTLSLEDARTSERVLAYRVDVERGIRGPLQEHPEAEFNDFFLDSYSEWCGKVHNGNKIKWQFCTGKDCPGGGICIKHCVKVAGTCIP
jgi:hypothetical protein